MNPEQILKEREARGLIISIYSHFAALIFFFFLTFLLDSKEISKYFVITFSVGFFLGLLLIPLKKKKWITIIGIFIAILDTLAISTLPFLWYSIGGNYLLPTSYLLKTYTFYLISAIIICVNGIALRPLFIGVSTLGVISIECILLYIVISDPRTKFTNNWGDIFMSEAINLKIQYNMIFMFGMLGIILMLITRSARNTIIKGIELEKVNSQFGRYFSPNIREELKNAKEDFFKPGGKIQEVVILFSDIRSFTAMSEEMGVENTLELLADYQKSMVEIIFSCGGTLDKFIGDGILASFGTPNSNEDDADKAVLCAIEMEKAIIELNKKRKIINKKEIEVGIGIHAGKAIVGNIGSEERLEYTVIGDTVNTASRVESMTKELKEKILITGSVLEKVTNKTQFRFVGEFTLRGKKEPTKLYSLV